MASGVMTAVAAALAVAVLVVAAAVDPVRASDDMGGAITLEEGRLTIAANDTVCFKSGDAAATCAGDLVLGSQLAELASDVGDVSVEASSNSNFASGLEGRISDLEDALGDYTTADTHETLSSRVEAISQQVVDEAASRGVDVGSLETRLGNAEQSLEELHDSAVATARSETEELVNDVVEDLTTEAEGSHESYLARFEELDLKASEAAMYTYSFSGSAAINDNFFYLLSVDYYGQGAGGDSSHVGNWFLEVEAKGGHCGGGCHYLYYEGSWALNGYCDMAALKNPSNKNVAHGGSFSVSRIADAYNGHGDVCGILKIAHNAGSYPYGGPYWIKVRSSKPLVVNKAHTTTNCAISCSGNKCGAGRCPAWSCRVSSCPNHRINPSSCEGAYSRAYLSSGTQTYGKCRVP